MTRKEIRKFLDNTKVYVNGKSKEIQEKLFSFGYTWNWDNRVKFTKEPFLFISGTGGITHSNDMVLFNKYEYREITADEILSLEITDPSYRPFKSQDECWREMHNHSDFGWVKHNYGNVFSIMALFSDSVKINEYDTTYSELCEKFKFMDGTPFGIKED